MKKIILSSAITLIVLAITMSGCTTGEAIKVGKSKVYTAKEVDDLLAQKVSRADVQAMIESQTNTFINKSTLLDLLRTVDNTGTADIPGGCIRAFVDGGSVSAYLNGLTCDTVCQNMNANKKCLIGYSNKKIESVTTTATSQDEIVGCDHINGPSNIDNINCICC